MSNTVSLFTFQLQNSWLAIPPDAVVTILDPHRYIPLPLAPNHILGLIPYGQAILPVFHLSLFLQLPEFHSDMTKQRLLVIQSNDLEVAIPIQQTGGVEHKTEQDISRNILTKNGRLQSFLLFEYDGAMGFTGALDLETLLERARV